MRRGKRRDRDVPAPGATRGKAAIGHAILLPLRPEGTGNRALAILSAFSPLCSFPADTQRESSAPKPVTRPWIPLRREDGLERVGENPKFAIGPCIHTDPSHT